MYCRHDFQIILAALQLIKVAAQIIAALCFVSRSPNKSYASLLCQIRRFSAGILIRCPGLSDICIRIGTPAENA